MSRATIAAAVVSTLTAAGVASGRVTRARTTEMPSGTTLPAVVVYCLDGSAESRSQTRARYRETWTVKLECWADGATDVALDDTLDAVRASCLAALFQDGDFAATYRMPGPVRTAVAYDVDANGRRGVASVEIPIEVEETYITTAQADGPPLTSVVATAEPTATATADGIGDFDE